MKLLLAEDESRLLKSLKHIFQRNQYVVDAVSTGTDALAYAETAEYDGLVLDIMLPGLDGLEVLRRIRSQGVSTPVLFLTARSEVYQRVEGLDAGADDYLAKPFSTAELLARVRAMLRRKDNYLPDLLRAGPLLLNRSAYTINCGPGTQSLSGRDFQIMEMLMERPSFIVTVDEIMAHVWGWDSDADVSVIWVHISNIRKKLARLGAPVSIRFVRSAGYVLEVRE